MYRVAKNFDHGTTEGIHKLMFYNVDRTEIWDFVLDILKKEEQNVLNDSLDKYDLLQQIEGHKILNEYTTAECFERIHENNELKKQLIGKDLQIESLKEELQAIKLGLIK